MPAKSLSPAINRFGPRHDRLTHAYALNGSGSDAAIANLVTNTGSKFDGRVNTFDGVGTVIDANDTVWTTVAGEGIVFDGTVDSAVAVGEKHWIKIGLNDESVQYNRGSLLLRFRTVGFSATDTRPILISSDTIDDFFVIQRRFDSPNYGIRLRFNGADAGVNQLLTWTIGAAAALTTWESSFHTIIITWGESGVKAWLDGVEPDIANLNAGANDSILFIENTTTLRFLINSELPITNGNLPDQYSGTQASAFYLWDVALTTNEIEELNFDPYLPIRPEPSTQFWTYVGPTVGRPTSDSITMRFVTDDATDGNTRYLRVTASTDTDFTTTITNDEDPYLGGIGVTAYGTNRTIDVVLTGLSPGTTYYYFCEYNTAGDFSGVNELFPMGLGKFVTQRASSDQTFSFVVYADDHLGNDNNNAGVDADDYWINDFQGRGFDIVDSGDARKWFSSWKADYDIYKNQNPDFIIHLGDAYMSDGHNPITGVFPSTGGFAAYDESYEDAPESKLTRAALWTQFHNLFLKRSSLFLTLGNHEAEAGYIQHSTNGRPLAMQKQSTIVRKRFFPNPTDTTYTEGGETGTEDEWIPTLDAKYDTTYLRNHVFEEGITDFANNTENTSPLENYYSWTWGDTLFVVLDVYRYADPGDKGGGPLAAGGFATPSIGNGGSHSRNNRDWTLGIKQRIWLENLLANSSAKWKVICLHNLVGGINSAVTGNGTDNVFYGRGSGSVLSSTEEQSLNELFKEHNVTVVFKGHDHKFAHVVNDTVNYITAPTVGAPSHTLGLNANRGWHFTKIQDSYGTAESLGALSSSGTAIPGMLKHYNTMGYLQVDVTETTFTVSLHQTSATVEDDYKSPSHAERFVADAKDEQSGGNVIFSTVVQADIENIVAAYEELPEDYWDRTNINTLVGDTGLYTTPVSFLPLESDSPSDPLTRSYYAEDAPGPSTNPITGAINVSLDSAVGSVFMFVTPRNLYSANLSNAAGPGSGEASYGLHNIRPENVVFCYRHGDADSLEVAQYYQLKRNIPTNNLIALPCNTNLYITEDEYETMIEAPLVAAIQNFGNLTSGGEPTIWVIILGPNVPIAFYSGDPYDPYDPNLIAVASRVHRLGQARSNEFPNIAFDRRGNFKFFDTDDAEVLYITAVIDAPTVALAKRLIDRSLTVDSLSFITGKVAVDPYGLNSTSDQTKYETDILDFVENELPNLGLLSQITVPRADGGDPQIEFLSKESFYWGWFTDTFSKDLFLNQNEKRVFLYNADNSAAANPRARFSSEGSDPWCNLAINVDPGYASCAGAVDNTLENAYLRPRPFFESLHRGTSLGEAFLYSSPFVDWKIILIGDPLMTVNFPVNLPIEQDSTNTLIPNNQAILESKEALEESLAWGMRQARVLQNVIDTNVLSINISEQLNLLPGLAQWLSVKNEESQNNLLTRSVDSLLTHILQTTNLTFEQWLSREGEKTTEFLNNLIRAGIAQGNVLSEFVYPEGHWEYEFVYIHPRLTLENVHFRLQLSRDPNFVNVVTTLDSSASITGWKYESEPFVFVQLVTTGFPSNFSGRSVRFVSTESEYLTRTEIYYVRWRPLDSNGLAFANYTIDPTPLLIKR